MTIGQTLKLILLTALMGFLLVSASRSRDVKGEFAQYTPQQRQWLKDQMVPGTNNHLCCNEADGTKAQEDDIKNGQYWISFEACYYPGSYLPMICNIVGPLPVPRDAVLTGPNPVGRPVVWYGWISWDAAKGEGVVWIRCFIPYDGN